MRVLGAKDMTLTTLHCDASGKRVQSSACLDAYSLANAGLARMSAYQRRALQPCVGCARGRRNRSRWATEGFRMGSGDASAWRNELAAWTRKHPELFAGDDSLDTAGEEP